ncbi:MAG: C25 family cysteine peptidase [bacterium]|nr:C25 family cysteine peptidase [bacterium]
MLKRSGNPAFAGKKCVSMKASPLRAQARRVGMIVLVLILAIPAMAGEIVKELKFNTADLEFSKLKDYDVVELKGGGFTGRVGFPMLPMKVLSFLIPPGASITKIEVISKTSEPIPGTYKICPAQPPQPISFTEQVEWVEPNEKVYSSISYYPTELVNSGHTGDMGGYRITGVFIHPIQYIPALGKLIFNSRIEFRIIYKEGIFPIPSVTLKQKEVFEDMVKTMIVNPEMVKIWNPITHYPIGSRTLPPDNIEYVVITADSFATEFQPLADWKTKKGVPAKVVTLDFIYANYSGVDNPDKIRNFIKDAHSNWGTIWVLLGGQGDFEHRQEVVPRRSVDYLDTLPLLPPAKLDSMNFCDYYIIPSDLYFSDLTGTWNADGDNIWGEVNDGEGETEDGQVDLYSDVFVGRAPARTKTQVATFVNKVITYEKNPPLDYETKILLPAVKLFSTDFGDYWGDTVNNAIADMVPADWQVSKLYESTGNLSKTALIDSLNSGFGFVHVATHGHEDGFYYADGTALLNWGDVDGLINGDNLFILNSIACLCGAMDYGADNDCFAEHFVNRIGGGAVATIMNSRFGWGRPALKRMYFSELIDTSFYHEIFVNNFYNLGRAHAASKDRYVSLATWGEDTVWVNPDSFYLARDKWPFCIYELNLFGDPELPMWTAEPKPIVVTHPSTIGVEPTTITVSVSSDEVPIPGALVCLAGISYGIYKIYESNTTNANGEATFTISPKSSIICVTVTKPNYLPYEGEITVVGNLPPDDPVCIFPPNGATNVWNVPKLIWSCRDPDGDPLSYNLYFGTDNPPITCVYTGADTFYNATLDYASTYYWKIVATDAEGASTEGNVWSFTTFKPGEGGVHTDTFYTIVCDSYNVIITTNSDIMTANQGELDHHSFDSHWDKAFGFNVAVQGTSGWCELTIPWDLLHRDTLRNIGFKVKVDDVIKEYDTVEVAGSYTKLYFTYPDGNHTVRFLAPICVCDVNEDGIIDIADIYITSLLYGHTPTTPPPPEWNPRADANKDKIIDIEDIYRVSLLYGVFSRERLPISESSFGNAMDQNTSAKGVIMRVEPAIPTSKVAIPKTTIMAVEPETTIAEQAGIAVGDTFMDSICITDVVNLGAWQTVIIYDPNILKPWRALEGPFLKDVVNAAGQGATHFACTADTLAGYVMPSACFWPDDYGLLPPHGATGSGILCYIRWKVKSAGDTPLDIRQYTPPIRPKLLDFPDNNPIPFDTVDGYFKWGPPEGIEETSINRPDKLLLQIYPNPFSQFTVISYQLPTKSRVLIRVYNISGRLVETLVDEMKEQGCYSIKWNAEKMANGIYFCRLEHGSEVLNRKMPVVKGR